MSSAMSASAIGFAKMDGQWFVFGNTKILSKGLFASIARSVVVKEARPSLEIFMPWGSTTV